MIKEIRERLRLIGFSVRQFLVILALVGGLLLFFQITELTQELESQKESMVSEMQSSLQLADVFVDDYADNIRSILLNVVLMDNLYEEKENVYLELNKIQKNEECIKTLFIVGKDGTVKASDQALYDAMKPPIVDEMKKRAEENPYMVQYSAAEYSNTSAGYTMYASYMSGGRIAIVETTRAYLLELLQHVLKKKDQSFVVLDQNGKEFLFSKNDFAIPLKNGTYPLGVEEEYQELLNQDWESMKLISIPQLPKQYFMCSEANNLGWHIIALYDKKPMDDYRKTLYRQSFSRIGIWLLGVAVIVFWLTALLTSPIRKLAKDMDQVNDLDHLMEIPHDNMNELGRLSSHYNRLILKIQELMNEVQETERKKLEFEFLMKQNQIGPHFLHNTLICVVSLIRQGKNDIAQEALKALIKLLAYTFEQNENPVRLKEEVEQVGNYVKIQQMRYGSQIRFETKIEENAGECEVLKLILQPLIENSIYHGIVPKEEGKLFLAARLRGNILHIFICDDGIGMTSEMCGKVLQGTNVPKNKDRVSSVGVSNVNERLKIKYGQKYGIRIKSEPGRGTIVCLRIPQN